MTGSREEPDHQIGSRGLEMSTFFLCLSRKQTNKQTNKKQKQTNKKPCYKSVPGPPSAFRIRGIYSGWPCLEMMHAESIQENKILQIWHSDPETKKEGYSIFFVFYILSVRLWDKHLTRHFPTDVYPNLSTNIQILHVQNSSCLSLSHFQTFYD